MYNFKQDLQAYQGQQADTSGSSKIKIPDFQEDFSAYSQNQGVASQKLASAEQLGQTIDNKISGARNKMQMAFVNEQMARQAEAEQNNTHQQGASEENNWIQPEIDYANVDLTNKDLKSIPEGMVGGQCGVFAENIVKLPNGGSWLVGDTIGEKANAVKRYRDSGMAFYKGEEMPEPGNSVIINPGTKWGHVAVINSINPDGTMTLTESNWNNDGRVTTDRTIPINSGSVVGFIRTK